MQASCAVPRDLALVFSHLVDVERLATTQEWWMYGRVLPEARRLAELTSILAAARVELSQLLETLGYPQPTPINSLGTSELRFAQSFAGDSGWANAHREEAISVLRLAALAVPILLAQIARVGHYLGEGYASLRIGNALRRLSHRLEEVRALSGGY